MALVVCLVVSTPAVAQSTVPTAQTPSAGRTVSLPLGSIDAVTGQLSLHVPLGPKLPGRIPLGFTWSFQKSPTAIDFSPAAASGIYQPVVWPKPGDPSASLQTTVLVNGEPWVFYPQAQPASGSGMPTSSSTWLSLMTVRGVNPTAPPMGESVGAGWTVYGAGVFHCTMAPSSDGTKFLLTYSYTTPVEKTDSSGNTTYGSQELGNGFAILDGADAIWTQASDQRYAVVIGQTKDVLTTFSNSWGDQVTVDETYTQRTSDAWSLEQIVLKDAHTSASITLQLQVGTPQIVSSTYQTSPNGPLLPYTAEIKSGSATAVVTASIPGVDAPTTTLTGSWDGKVRKTILPAYTCPGYDVNAVSTPILGDFDWWFLPTSIQAKASDGSTRTTSFGFSAQAGIAVTLGSITLPSGLVETFGSGTAGTSLSPYSFSFCSGIWGGFSATYPVSTPGSTINFSSSNPESSSWLVANIAGVGNTGGQWITVADPNDSDPTHGQAILITSVSPAWTATNNTTLQLQGNQHVTTILRYGTSSPTASSPFRGVRLTHPSFSDVGSDYAGIHGYLFATSAIVQEDAITGQGAPSYPNYPSGTYWQPSSVTVNQTTVYDGFDLHNWVNPTGALGTSLPVTAVARRTRVYTPSTATTPGGLPTKTTLAGDPSDSTACDDRGPIRTDEWTTDPQSATTAATVLAQSAGSSQVGFSNSTPSTTTLVHRRGQVGRHFDWTLLRLMTDSDHKTLDGSYLQALRGTSSADFGTTAYTYDGLGRITSQVGTRGAFAATESRTYNGNLPQIADTTKTLTQNGTTLYANPANTAVVVGTHTTFDTTYYQWAKTETDKVDGRPVTFLSRDGMGRVTAQTDVLGVETDTAYDGWGHAKSVSRAAKGTVGSMTTQTTYDPNGRWKTETVTEGDTGRAVTTTTTLDAFGRVTQVQTLDASGKNGTVQTFQYDGFGEKTAASPVLTITNGVTQSSAWGASTGKEAWAYDDQGRVTDHWDAQGRLLMHVVQQPSWQTLQGVTAVWTTTQDDRNYTRSDGHDILGQKAGVVDQAGNLSTYTYDQDGHLIGTNQGGQTRSYTYNDMGWLTSRTEPEEGTTSYGTFNMLGTPLVTTQAGSTGTRTFTTTLDAHLQPSQIAASGPEGTVTRTLSYDYSTTNTHLLTGVDEVQALAGATAQEVVETYGYDPIGRLTSKSITDKTQTFAVSQTLDAAGHVTSLTYPSGGGRAAQTETLAYDSLGRAQTAKLDGALRAMMVYGTVSGTAVTNTLILGNGAQSVSTVNRGELVETQHLAGSTVVEDNLMTWTAGGLMQSRGPSANPDTFGYDALQRLVHSKVIGVYGETEEQWYAYDRNGNRTQSNFQYTAAGASTQPTEALAWSGTYGSNNQLPQSLTALAPGAPGTASTGSLSTGVLYDDLGRMTQVWTTPGQVSTQTTWVYDPSGRVMKENGTSYLLEASGLRFRRTKTDGTVDYTVYGFGREPLAQFEIPPPPKTQTTTMAPRTAMTMSSGTFDPAGAYILQPSGPITVAPGQVINFQGSTDFGTNFTWTFGDGATASGLTASHAFTTVGTYTVSFQATATGYTGSTARVTITVMAKPSITSFTASPSSLTSGQSSTLSWNVTGATSLSINQGVGTVTGTSVTVTPSATTTYTLTATNAAGSVTATATITVSAPPPPTIASFTASASPIAIGSSTTLSWVTSNATSLSISPGVGTVTGTSVAVSPAQTTSYTLTATNASGSATATITVVVETQLPVITDFWSNPYEISSGQSATLNWAVSLADSLKLGTTVVTGTTSSTVSPTTTTTYTLTAMNLVGSVSATVTVSVGTPGSLVWKKTIVYGFGQELAEDQPGMGTTFIQSDYVGSPSITTDPNGVVIGRSKALPFGERYGQWGQKTIRRYTNHEDDTDSGAIYMQAREYLPAYGKFAQVDPAYDQTKDDPESWNLYNYVTNNPVTHTDPDGRMVNNTDADFALAQSWANSVDDWTAMADFAEEQLVKEAMESCTSTVTYENPATGETTVVTSTLGWSGVTTKVETVGPACATASASAQTGTNGTSAGFTLGTGGQASGSNGNAMSPNAKSTTFLGVKIYFNFDTASPAGVAYLDDALSVIQSQYGRSVLNEYHSAHPDGQVVINMNGKSPNDNPAFSAQGAAAGQPYLAQISINTSLRYFDQVKMPNGSRPFVQFAIVEVFAHEFGHLVTPHDSGGNHMENVNRNENRWRAEVGLPERVDYENGRVSY